MWLCIGGGMITLLLAAIGKRNKGLCKEYSISIKGVRENFFIDEKDVEKLLMKTTNGSIKGEPVASFNLHALESMLEHNTWIDDAELYFDNKDVLHITVLEKEPVARMFTTAGSSFYIDSLARKIPLSDKLSARVTVFTGFPDKKKLTKKDSVLLNDVRVTANYIFNNPFWVSQVAQIDITPAGSFEMVPVVGNHIVKLGTGENIDKKFNRLMIFYQQVLSKTGFDKYKVIDVQYAGQVVVSKSTGDAKVDSVQLKKNVEKLLQHSRDAEHDTTARVLPAVRQAALENDEDAAPANEMNLTEQASEHGNPNPLKPTLSEKPADDSKPASKPDAKPAKKPEERKPKAVMPKRRVE
jgi:cell division protein FtsQ